MAQKSQKSEKKTYAKLEGEQIDAFEEWRDDMSFDTDTEACTEAVKVGLKSAGYNGARIDHETTLMRALRKGMTYTGISGFTLAAMGLILWNPTAGKAGAVLLLAMSLMAAGHVTAQKTEPALSHRIKCRVDPRKDICEEEGA